MAKPFIKNNKFIAMMSTNRRIHIVFDSKKKRWTIEFETW